MAKRQRKPSVKAVIAQLELDNKRANDRDIIEVVRGYNKVPVGILQLHMWRVSPRLRKVLMKILARRTKEELVGRAVLKAASLEASSGKPI